MPVLPPPRKNPPTVHFVKPERTPLQTLIFLGISKERAEKALAATGNGCAKKAMNWLISHVNDPKLDEHEMLREYILYAVPVGAFGEQLLNFWHDSRELCSWNEAHNRLPHVTLVSFFKASADIEPEISRSVKTVVDGLNAYLEKRIELRLHHDEKFIGFFLESSDKLLFENIAYAFVDAVKAIHIEDFNQSSALMACCPWARCTVPMTPLDTNNVRCAPARANGSFDGEEHDQLHMTLAYKYDKMDSITLSSMLDRFEYVDASSWEIRLYSRDIRVGQNQVFRATQKYRARAHDELSVNIGDHIVATEMAVNNADEEGGWIYGISLTSGDLGFFPANHSLRVPESDCWSLHTRVHFVGSKCNRYHVEPITDANIRVPQISLEDCARAAIDSERKTVPWKPTIGKLLENPKDSQKLLIMRHAERVDYTFPKWTEQCFTEAFGYERLDLNLPLALPIRRDGVYRYPWKFDSPITNIGVNQAFLTGQMLKDQGVNIGFVYCSPAFRCIQTAQAVLQGLESPLNIKIRIEPALFEWCAFYTEIPQFLTAQELEAGGYNVDVQYVPLLECDDLKYKQRGESLETFYQRNHRVSDYAVKRSSENTLIVAHAANLETNSRLLLEGHPMNLRSMRELMEKVPYASLLALEKNEYLGKWTVAKPLILPLTHSRNFQFDSRIFAEQPNRSNIPSQT